MEVGATFSPIHSMLTFPRLPNASGLNSWQLAAVEQLTAAGKSLVVAAAVMHGRLGVDAATSLSRLEEEYQMEDWGSVEVSMSL